MSLQFMLYTISFFVSHNQNEHLWKFETINQTIAPANFLPTTAVHINFSQLAVRMRLHASTQKTNES